MYKSSTGSERAHGSLGRNNAWITKEERVPPIISTKYRLIREIWREKINRGAKLSPKKALIKFWEIFFTDLPCFSITTVYKSRRGYLIG